MKLNKDRLASILPDAGNFFLDIAKLIIGGVLLAGIMKEDIDRPVLYGLGLFFVLLMSLLGFFLLMLSDDSKKEEK